MLTMDYRLVDVLLSNQLEPGDLIDFKGEIVLIVDIAETNHGYILTIENDFNEKEIVEISDDEEFELYILE